MSTINYKDLMSYGFPEHTARTIIRQSKLEMVKSGHSIYQSKRIGIVPVSVAEKIVGFSLEHSLKENR